MLTVTSNAVTVLKAAKAAAGAPVEAGVHIVSSPAGNDSGSNVLAIGFAISDDAPVNNEEFEQDGLRFFLEPQLADTLDGRILDVEPSDNGPAMVLR